MIFGARPGRWLPEGSGASSWKWNQIVSVHRQLKALSTWPPKFDFRSESAGPDPDLEETKRMLEEILRVALKISSSPPRGGSPRGENVAPKSAKPTSPSCGSGSKGSSKAKTVMAKRRRKMSPNGPESARRRS
eukprot:scaffold892_cov164-Pinguiococcus_pyrenoidosus.AAC.1